MAAEDNNIMALEGPGIYECHSLSQLFYIAFTELMPPSIKVHFNGNSLPHWHRKHGIPGAAEAF